MRHRILLILWLVTDLIVFLKSYMLAYFMKVGWIFSTDLPVQQFLIAVAIAAVPWLLALATTRTFALTRSQSTLRNLIYIAYACVMGAAFVTLAHYFLFGTLFSRMLLIEAAVISMVATFVWHMIFEWILRVSLNKSPASFPTLIVGLTRESRMLINTLKKNKSPLCPVGIIVPEGTSEKEVEGVPVLGKLPKLEEALTKMGITHLIQASDLEQSLNLLGMCRTHGLHYLLLPPSGDFLEKLHQRPNSNTEWPGKLARRPSSSSKRSN
jgi:FlaA1/EpsC-like NDP-sugar epimerase